MHNTAYEYIDSPGKLRACGAKIGDPKIIAVDTETTSQPLYANVEGAALHPHTGRVRLAQIGLPDGQNFLIDVWKTNHSLGPFEKLLRNDSVVKIFQNAKFDMKYLMYEWGIEPEKVYDTMIASGILACGVRGVSHKLKAVAARYLGVHLDKSEQKSDWGRAELTDSQLQYASDDTRWLFPIREKQIEKLKHMALIRCAKIEFDALLPVACMELAGMDIHRRAWLDNEARAIKLSTHLEREIKAILNDTLPALQMSFGTEGLDFDAGVEMSSNPQLLRALKRLGEMEEIQALQDLQNTQADTFKLMEGVHPVLAHIIKYRQAVKNITTYGEPWLAHCCPACGRVHSSFWPLTAAGRYSSKEPNFQNIPRSPLYRGCFVPDEDCDLNIWDYSQIELRTACEIANDQGMLDVFLSGGDIHTETARAMANDPTIQKKDPRRQAAKAVNFGLVYGMGAETLAIYAKTDYGVDMTVKQAERYRHRYFKRYPDIKRWHQFAVDKAQKQRRVRTLSGRIRFIDENMYSEILNTPVQGTATGDAIKVALRIAYNRLKGKRARLVNMVHDELVAESHKSESVEVGEIIKSSMIDAMKEFLKIVPIEVEGGIGPSWAEK